MAEADDARAREARAQALAPPALRARVVHEADPQPADLDRLLGRQAGSDVPAVAVAGDAVERGQRPELVEQRRVGHVARVEDVIGLGAGRDHRHGQWPLAPRPQVRIARDDDADRRHTMVQETTLSFLPTRLAVFLPPPPSR